MSVTTAQAPSREQLIEVVAALRASADAMLQVHDLDSGAAEFFANLAHRLQDEFFGDEHVDSDEWHHDPIEVAIYARAAELEADALAEEGPFKSRIDQLRQMAPRYRDLGTINIPFEFVLKCSSCGGMATTEHEGWTSAWRDDKDMILCPSCSEDSNAS